MIIEYASGEVMQKSPCVLALPDFQGLAMELRLLTGRRKGFWKGTAKGRSQTGKLNVVRKQFTRRRLPDSPESGSVEAFQVV